VPGYSLFRIEVIGAATQYVVIDAAGEKVPWCDCPHRFAEILKADEAGDRDQQVGKQLVIADLPYQHIAIAPHGLKQRLAVVLILAILPQTLMGQTYTWRIAVCRPGLASLHRSK
jgi:hypothetical protein